jgi:GxxExxY protein
VTENALTEHIIVAAIHVHLGLGPGLLEGVYRQAMLIELRERGLECASQVRVPLMYRDQPLATDSRLDLFVEGRIVVLKSVDALLPIHQAQLLTYLRLTGHQVGLLVNFNVPTLRNGVKRIVNNFMGPPLTAVAD